MASFCGYRNCQNLASSTYHGYCTEDHFKRGKDDEFIEEHYDRLKRIFPKLAKLFGSTV